MAYRRGETDEGLLLQDFADRLRLLEEIASRRVLPPGYQFTYNGSGDLIVKRIIDGADETLLPLTGGGGSSPPFLISDITGLQAALNGKALLVHTHVPTDITGFNAAAVAAILAADGSGSGLDADLLDGQNGSYYLARGNHTGTQLAATVSDFDAQVDTHQIHDLALPTAATPMNGQIFTGLGAGTAAGDSVRYEQVVRLVDAQTIAGVKTFSDIPELPAVNPTTANQATRKQYVDDAIAALVDSSPATLDTLNELAAALGDDPNFATTIATALAAKLDAAVAATTYLKLDTTNGPLTGNLVGPGLHATGPGITPGAEMVGSYGVYSALAAIGVMRAASTHNAYAVAVQNDADLRWRIRADGQMLWGAGAAVGDVGFERSAANILKMLAGDKWQQAAAPTVGDDLINKTYGDTTYLKLDTSNDPLTGNLTISKSTPTLQMFDAIGGESLLRDTGLWFYAIAGDANPTALLRGDGFSKLAFGAGAASPLDWEMSRTAANVVSLAAGDDLRRPAGEDGTHDDSMVRKAQLAAKNITVTETGLIIPSATNVQQALAQTEAYVQNLEERFEQHTHAPSPYGWIYNTATSGTIVAITASGGFIALPWNADLYDKWDAHDPVTNNTRIHLGAIATGIWEVGATAFFGSPSLTAGQDFYMSVRKNGSGATNDHFWAGGYFAPPTVGVTPIPGMMTVVHINSSSDYVEVGAQIDGGTTLNFTGTTSHYATNKAWFKYIGPA